MKQNLEGRVGDSKETNTATVCLLAISYLFLFQSQSLFHQMC